MIMNSEASTASETSTAGAGGANCCGANANCTSLKRDCPSASVYKRTYLTTASYFRSAVSRRRVQRDTPTTEGQQSCPSASSRGSRTYPRALGVQHSRYLGSSCPAPQSCQRRRQLLSSRPAFGFCPRVLLGPFMRRSRLHRAVIAPRRRELLEPSEANHLLSDRDGEATAGPDETAGADETEERWSARRCRSRT